MLRAAALALVLLAATLSACLSSTPIDVAGGALAGRIGPDGLSTNLSLKWRHEVATLASKLDGVTLSADLFRPDTAEKAPVVLVLSPYFNAGKRGADALPSNRAYAWLVTTLVPRGYAVALADLRGTAGSGGCMDFGGPGERQDAYDWVEWLGTREWSSGKVGMLGKSYDGYTALMAAAMRPPHLAAIEPVAPIADWYRGLGMGGAKYTVWDPLTALEYNFQIGFEAPRDEAGRLALAERLTHPDCYLANQAFSDDPTGDYTDWFAARDLNPLAANATAAMFYVHGLVDVNAKPDHAVPWYAHYGGPKKAWLYQAPHVWPFDENTGRGNDWWRETQRFLDHYLLALPNGVEREMGVVQIQDNLRAWRNESTFPPADVRPFALYPGADGKLAPSPASAGTLAFVDDERNGGGLAPAADALPATPGGPSLLAWSSAPLAQALHLSGEPVATFHASFSRSAGLLVTYLSDCKGATCRLVDRGVMSARHRDGVDHPQVVTPGESYTVSVRMYPRDWVFEAGHTVKLEVTGSDHAWILPTGGAGTTTLALGGEAKSASALVLPEDPAVAPWGHAWGKNQGDYAPS